MTLEYNSSIIGLSKKSNMKGVSTLIKFSLKELRARKDWTQQQTANKLGISVQTYCAWEKDLSNVAVSKVLAVANLFDVQLDEIKL